MSPTELREAIYRAHKVTLLACYWTAGTDRTLPGLTNASHTLYASEHIPTALFCDPATALASVPGSADGRNPMPTTETLDFWFRSWGLRRNRTVVVYDNQHGRYAARAWWILRWAGVEDVRILDGSLAAWESGGHPILAGPGNQQQNSNLVPAPGQLPLATIEDVRDFDGVLIDAREPRRYEGKRELLDLRAGHIPGAINVPARDMVNEDNTFRTPEEIRGRLAEAGITGDEDMIVYSGSGNHSAQLLAAMHIAGITGAAHYVGGWSQWSADPDNPIADRVALYA